MQREDALKRIHRISKKPQILDDTDCDGINMYSSYYSNQYSSFAPGPREYYRYYTSLRY